MAHTAKNVSPEAEVKSWGFKQVFLHLDRRPGHPLPPAQPPGFDDAPHHERQPHHNLSRGREPGQGNTRRGRACRRGSRATARGLGQHAGLHHGHRGIENPARS
ncbi:hypothetical protein HYQ44_002085 [Verticillium longisporum]|nr:hypothetical protein HYQ44_002085 [Verticillium longisporum]